MKNKFIVVIFFTIVVGLIITGIVFATNEYEIKKKQEIEEERIKIAKTAVDNANNSKDISDINEAKEYIELIETEDIKEELIISIENLELEIKKDNVRDEFNNLLASVENSLKQEELNDLVVKINEIEYEEIKTELLEKTKPIQEKITKEKERLEQLAYYNKMKEIDTTLVISTPPDDVIVLETLTGKITAFTPYCSDGCAGYTASGKFVGDGDIYQYDSQYGMVRIVAADPSYPFGTIVRIKNLSYFGSDVYAIVLDRGGAIGKNRRALFDLLFATEENANRFGVENNIECEILRLGY